MFSSFVVYLWVIIRPSKYSSILVILGRRCGFAYEEIYKSCNYQIEDLKYSFNRTINTLMIILMVETKFIKKLLLGSIFNKVPLPKLLRGKWILGTFQYRLYLAVKLIHLIHFDSADRNRKSVYRSNYLWQGKCSKTNTVWRFDGVNLAL